MPDLRNSGFGLNFNRGFGSRGGFVGGGMSPDQGAAAQGYQRRLGQQDQFGQDQQLQRDRFAQDNNRLALDLNQRERDSQRDAQLRQQGYANQLAIAGQQAAASELPARLQQQRFDQVFGYLSGQLGGLGLAAGGGGGGASVPGPGTGNAEVFSQEQIQQQVNARRASNDAAAAGAQRRLGQQMAARGYGSRSPLAMELGVGIQNQALAQNTADERDTRYQAAQANAQHSLGAQQNANQAYADRQQEDIQRRQIAAGRYNALLAALAGIV